MHYPMTNPTLETDFQSINLFTIYFFIFFSLIYVSDDFTVSFLLSSSTPPASFYSVLSFG